jgi:hypothetical protein
VIKGKEVRLFGARFLPAEGLFHQKDRTRSLDFARNFPVEVSWHPSDAPWQNLATFGDKFSQKIRIFVIDGFGRDINTTPRHDPVCASKIRPPLCIFWFHCSLDLPMEGTPSKERIVFFLLETAGSVRAFFVAGAYVARSRFTFCFRLRALKSDDFPGHDC